MTISENTLQVNLKTVIGPAFFEVHKKIRSGSVDEVVLPGGRGSLKSSFSGSEVVLFILRHPECHALITRQIADTMRDSVYAQIVWSIEKLGLAGKFRCTQSPMQCIYKPTGQRILFRGLDDPYKIKSIKLPFGYIGCLWFEEADQIKGGEAAVRNVQQSALRGGPLALTIISFNPPAATRNWANRYIREQRPGKLIHPTSYLQAPPEWLGPKFLQQAEWIRKTRPTTYRHEYLGEAVGNGTQVFDNIRLERITPAKIKSFGEIVSGVDWGWYPDPWAFNRTAYDAARRTLYIFDEATRRKLNNFETGKIVQERVEPGENVIADSAEKKSCGDYRDMGINCFDAVKRPGSVVSSMRWLQGLAAIVIDPERCPDTAREFAEYEYETAKDGEVIQAYVDADNHHIDAVRYATNRIWLRVGT